MTGWTCGMWRHAVTLGVVAAASLLLSACSKGESRTADVPAPPETGEHVALEVRLSPEQVRHGGVRWGNVIKTRAAEFVDVPGRLVPDEDRTARLSAPMQGRLVAIAARVGDTVHRGQALATLQSQDAVAVRADLAKAAAELRARDTAMAFAQTAYDRAVRLLELKAMSRQDVERARVERESAIAMQSQAQAEVERARMTLGQLGVDPENGTLVIRAPIAGVVLGRDAVPGSVVSAGTSLVTVTDPATLWLEIAATERLATSLRSGSTVRFTVQELGDSTFEAVVQGVAGALDPATRTLPIRAVVHNTSRQLRLEMFATVRVEQSEARAAVSVPDDAIQLLDERPVVFVARPDGKGGVRLERRDVELGARVNGRTQVLSGIAATEVIVTEGAFAVKSEFARAKMPSEG